VALPLRTLMTEPRPDRFEDGAPRRQDAQHGHCTAVYDRLGIHEHLELSVPAVDHVHIRCELPSQVRRHTGGMQTCHSIGAEPDGNPSHDHLSAHGLRSKRTGGFDDPLIFRSTAYVAVVRR
jgi:hypothetical protein